MGWNGKKLLKRTPNALESFTPVHLFSNTRVVCHLQKLCGRLMSGETSVDDLVVVAAHLNCQPALPYCLPGYSTKFLESPKGKS